MSYLHCHTKDCHWSQDDFWDWKWTWRFWSFRPFGYNPLSLLVDDFRTWSKPRMIDTNDGRRFSWSILVSEGWRHVRRLWTMKWWTYSSWKNDKGAVCPRCRQKNWDID